MKKGDRLWFKQKKISGTLYNNGILIACNPDDTMDVDIGITVLVVKTEDLLQSEGLEDLNGMKVILNRKQRRSLLPSAA
jgi:citrate lyase gamma subunit